MRWVCLWKLLFEEIIQDISTFPGDLCLLPGYPVGMTAYLLKPDYGHRISLRSRNGTGGRKRGAYYHAKDVFSRVKKFQWYRAKVNLRHNRDPALPVIAYLSCGAFCSAGPTITGIKAKVYFAPVR